ncbi:hypothetical protein BpHYR1_040967, partial [Brachionus plicatilis]
MNRYPTDSGTDDDNRSRAPTRKLKSSYKRSSNGNNSEERGKQYKNESKITRQKDYDNNREINNLSSITEKSIIETMAPSNIASKILNIFGWNKQHQMPNFYQQQQYQHQYQQYIQNQ